MYDDNREEGREQMKATENPEDEEEVKNAKETDRWPRRDHVKNVERREGSQAQPGPDAKGRFRCPCQRNGRRGSELPPLSGTQSGVVRVDES
ncbi:hypothetical protein C0Q70_17523 [Pomacea canaliculata]|uniref:Uncharacterized protein n=1 Tax=Pomacea canaliculata TaxID=400727 RepID=A0A2T7NKM7_POMCA|nr:hypothetical protein C0Q70_17523 [Pomacea canaliculata]